MLAGSLLSLFQSPKRDQKSRESQPNQMIKSLSMLYRPRAQTFPWQEGSGEMQNLMRPRYF